jgi:hypothetical protein
MTAGCLKSSCRITTGLPERRQRPRCCGRCISSPSIRLSACSPQTRPIARRTRRAIDAIGCLPRCDRGEQRMSLTTLNSSAVILQFQPKPSGGDRFVMLRHDLLNSPAWQSLPAVARALYVEMAARYNGRNNGHIVYSVRDAERALHISHATAFRVLRLLEWHGLIRCTSRGSFSRKDAKASKWELTDCLTVSPENPYGFTREPVNGSNGFTREPLIDKSLELRTGRWDFRTRKDQKEKKEAEARLQQYRAQAKANGGGQ